MTKPMTCCICQNPIDVNAISGWTQGHNAAPVVEDGRCCTSCNASVVVPSRINQIISRALPQKKENEND